MLFRSDRWGRVLGLAVFAVPLTLVIAVVCVAVVGRWDLLLGILGITIGALLTGFGVSSVLSGAFATRVYHGNDVFLSVSPRVECNEGHEVTISSKGSWSKEGARMIRSACLTHVTCRKSECHSSASSSVRN